MSKNIFLGTKNQSGPRPMYVDSGLCTWVKACVHRHTSAHATKVLEA